MEGLQLENDHCRRQLNSHLNHNQLYRQQHRSGLSTREASPDSVIHALHSHFSGLFSSSDASDTCLHLAWSERESWSVGGPDPDSNKTSTASVHHKHVVKAEAQKEDHGCDVERENDEDEDGEEDHNLPIYSARSPFSLALKECQERRSRSEALSRESDRREPASVDFKDGTASSPKTGAVKARSTGSRKSGTFPSPGTPNYWNPSIGLQKGWSSECVPLQSYAGMKNGSAAHLPFNHNGRTLQSKWEDAGRWIFSPVSMDNFVSPSVPPLLHRWPKSKSGPLGPPGVASSSLYSPATPMCGGGNMGSFMGRSPLCAGVTGTERSQTSGSRGFSPQVRADHCIGRSVSVHGYCDLLDNQTCSVHQDENWDQQKSAATDTLRTVSRRVMATQMSPNGSTCSSPKTTLSSSASPPDLQIVERPSVHSPKLEMKDLLVDERVIVNRRSKKSKYPIPGKSSGNSGQWKTKDANVQSCVVKSISNVRREEAKITAWENLQKAKAEAAIRKLEMKLEKKRSSSMDKIMKKLRSAQKRAQEARSSSALVNQDPRTSNSPRKALVSHRAHPVGSLSGCFTCHHF